MMASMMDLREREKVSFRYFGEGKLPKKVYEGDSKNVTINLRPSLKSFEIDKEPIHIQGTKKGISIDLQFLASGNPDEYLEFEFMASGFSIEGEKKQKQPLTSNILQYQWSCFFPNSGNHDFAFIVRVVTPEHCVEIGRIENVIKVVKVDHMTQRQVWVYATMASIFSGCLAIAEALHRLDVW